MLVAETTEDKIIDILDISSITRLGEGLKQRGYLSHDAMERAFRVLEKYARIIAENQVREVLCVGTSALQEATNSETFLRMVRDRLQMSIRVISEGNR
jgi:exopolyphosphatase / guanosine-5'-triphosphate,3'-diphosphate pyrophosphatase